MADLEAVLADVSYLMAMEMSKSTPAARASKKITLPDPSIRSVMMKYLEKRDELTFDKIFNQRLGYLLFKDYCLNHHEEPVPQIRFYEEIKKLESLETDEERITLGKEIYDQFIMKDLLSQSHEFSKETVARVLDLLTTAQRTRILPPDTFSPYLEEICESIRGDIFAAFLRSPRFTRFCQWKNLELNLNLTANDFSVHRIIGRGGFGEVYGCRKADTGKMYAMKCLDKKRIKMKGGESLALNERAMLSLVSTGEGCPFIVCMTYAFQTPEKLCFILDLMNGGDLHYHLTQHNVFNEAEVRFYATEVILGLEHMHNRFIVYRDLKPANILLDEYGHVRISDLGLACDFSHKRPHASVGTHGYMAPEVLQRGRSYDSSADWFSLGCMLYKLLRGHSPFRHHKVRDKHEIDRMTMTMDIELPEDLSPEMYSLLSNLLARDVERRLGCMGRGALEVREHAFFKDIDWQMVYNRKYPPPLIPPRGEVNAADAFDIGSFDEEDTKYIKLTESDLEPYKNFPLVVSERWQLEIAETVFDVVNQEADRVENKRRSKQPQTQSSSSQCTSPHPGSSALAGPGTPSPSTAFGSPSSSRQKNPTSETSTDDSGLTDSHSSASAQVDSDCIVEGDVLKLVGPFFQTWQRKFLRLFPNRLELYAKSRDGSVVKKGVELISMVDIREISPSFQRMYKMDNCLTITLKNDSKLIITSNDKILIKQWKEELEEAFQISNELISNLNKKAHKVYGADSPMRPSTPDSLSARTPTRSANCGENSEGDAASDGSANASSRNLVRQTSVPALAFQKPLNKLYSLTTTNSPGDGVSHHFEHSPARSNVGPIAERESETEEEKRSPRNDVTEAV